MKMYAKVKKKSSVILAGILCLSSLAFPPISTTVSAAEAEVLPYQNTSLTFEERATDLVSRMTMAEKASQLNTSAPAIPRLGIKANNWWQESLHGVAWSRAVSFPSSLSMSLTWDPQLLLDSASIIGDESRGYNTTNGRPLSNFSPTINMQRDPRWGRNEEGYGEDPFLVSILGEQYIHGVQGSSDTDNLSPSGQQYLKTIATLKHYAANNSEQNRYTGSSDVDDRSLREYYTAPFRHITETANPESVMSSYNRINGIPASANTYVLDTLLRKTWGFNGYVVSDCEGINWMRSGHKWIPSNPEGYTQQVTMPQATAFAMMAGTDLACNWTQGGNYGGDYSNNVAAAIQDGVLTDNGVMTEDIVDRALVRLFTSRMKIGEFDNAEDNIYRSYTVANRVETPYNVATSLKASRNAIVMLKNSENTLPIKTDTVKSIAVVGKFNDICELGDSNYAGSPSTKVSFQKGLTDALNGKGFDTANNLKFYNLSGSKVSGYIFNIRDFTYNNNVVSAVSANRYSDCRAETSNIGYINDGGYAVYQGFDLGSGIESFAVSISTNGTSGNVKPVVELHVDSPTGPVIATATCDRTGSWSSYSTNSGTVATDIANLYQGKKDIYLVFTTNQSSSGSDTALAEIEKADMAIYMAGTGTSSGLNVAGENRDRSNMNFPAGQTEEIAKVMEANPNTVVAIQAVGTMNISDFADDAKAILYTSYNGQFQGQAMAEVLLGDQNANGRLSFTWYANEAQLPNILDYSIRPEGEKLGRTYQYFKGDVLYPFGYGLSYSDFEYSNFQISERTVATDGTFDVSVDVENKSNVAGADVVQVYVSAPGAGNGEMPIKQLKGFQRVELAAREKQTVTVTVKADDLWFINEDGKRVVSEGEYTVAVGRSSNDIKKDWKLEVSGVAAPRLTAVTLTGDKIKVTNDVQVNTQLTISLNDESCIVNPTPQQATVVYSSSNPAVASVDEKGVITNQSLAGTALITATVTVGGDTLKATYAVTTDEGAESEKHTITFNITPPDAPDLTIVVEQGNPAVVVPSTENPLVYQLGSGEYSYTASAAGYKTAHGSFTVTGANTIEIALEKEDSEKHTITFNITPADAPDLTIAVEQGNPAVVVPSTENPLVYQLGAGEYSYTASATGYKTAHGSFTVTGADTIGIELEKEDQEEIQVEKVSITGSAMINLKRNKSIQLTAVVAPENATNQELTWSTLTPNLLTVDENGLVTANNETGIAVIVATAHNGKAAQITIRVIP
ncbi:glycoside hydrolase family 3 C-terminal domain-containing protein [Oscillospiraceae bacterium MB08-C2-2]|nr:glycoside hydrolase family 3 C-terminal domain-containing protein [Oscillospiraceae bacterium MB08-C2-2]